MIYEYYDFDLAEIIYTSSIDDKTKNYILKQLIKGIKNIHQKNIIHKDLKPDNILLKNDLSLCINDFSLSEKVAFSNKECCAKLYRAPEIYKNEKYSNKIDIWSFGVIMYELMFNSKFLNCDEKDIKSKIENYNIKENKNLNNLIQPYQKIIINCLSKNPDERLSASQILDMFEN
jgi:serine/threonine protein kinase